MVVTNLINSNICINPLPKWRSYNNALYCNEIVTEPMNWNTINEKERHKFSFVKNPTIFPNFSISPHQNLNVPHLHNSINETPCKSSTIPSKIRHQLTRQRVQSQLLINKKQTLFQNNLIVEFIVKNHRRVLVQKSCRISVGPANPAQLGPQTSLHIGVVEPVTKETTVRHTDSVRSQQRHHFIQRQAVCGERSLRTRHSGTWPRKRHVRGSRHEAVTPSRCDVVSGPTCHGHGITCGQGYYIRAWNRWRARCLQLLFYFVYQLEPPNGAVCPWGFLRLVALGWIY